MKPGDERENVSVALEMGQRNTSPRVTTTAGDCFFKTVPILCALLIALAAPALGANTNAAASLPAGATNSPSASSSTNQPAAAPAANNASQDFGNMDLTALMQVEVPVVTAASKVAQKTTEAPASVTVINADEIQKYQARTLADVLRTVQGFNVSYDRDYAFLDARGLSLGDFNSRILLLVDGHRVNNNLTDGAFIDTAFILDMDLVDHIEISRGPNAVLYGNNAFFGVINVVTKGAAQFNGFEASAEGGSFDSFKGRATYGKVYTNGVEMLVSGTYYDSAGHDNLYYPEFNTPTQNNGVAHDVDGDQYESLFGSLKYTDFTLESGYIARTKVNPTGQYSYVFPGGIVSTFDDSALRTTDDRSYAALKFAHSVPDVVDVTAQVYYDRYTHDIGYPETVIMGATVTPQPFTEEHDTGQWWGSELQLTKEIFEKHTLTAGAEYRDDFHQESELTGQTPVELTRQSVGVYGQGDFELLNSLHLEAGVRYDKTTSYPSDTTPRVALIYHPATNTTLKAIYGTAYRTPNFEELSNPGFQNISPENITTYELVYEQEIGPHVRTSFSGFYNQMHNLIIFDSGNYTNMDASTLGSELAVEGIFGNGIKSRVSYSYQHTRDETLGWSMPDSPNHLVRANLSVPVWRDKIFADAEFQFVSDRASLNNIPGVSGPLTVQGETAGAYELVNLTLYSRELVKHLQLSASIYNLFNKQYSDPVSPQFRVPGQDLIPQDGRTFAIKATYRF